MSHMELRGRGGGHRGVEAMGLAGQGEDNVWMGILISRDQFKISKLLET